MQRVGSTRPTFVSSVSKLCRYSTDKPVKPRELVTEWSGIVIPSRTEIQEKTRKREELKTDLSYLKNAPSYSLAGRLARRKEAAPAEPKPQAEPISPEAIKAAAQKRREIRIARETAEANAALRAFKPSSALSKVAAASYQPLPAVSRTAPPPTDNTRSQRAFTPRDSNAPRRPSSVGQRSAPASRRQQPSTTEDRKVQTDAIPEAEETVKPEAQESSIPEAKDASQEQVETLPPHPLALAAKSQPIIITPDSGLIEEDSGKNRRDRVSAALVKRTQRRIRDGLIDESEVPKELKVGKVVQPTYKPKATLEKSHLSSIEKRREERLRRAKEAENVNMSRGSRRDDYSTNRHQTNTRRASGPNTRNRNSRQRDEDNDEDIEEAVEEDATYLTSPEPISLTLTEIFKGTPAFRSAGFKSAGLNKESYSSYVPASTAALFSIPTSELSAVDMATAALSHRADISIPRRKTAVDLVAAATRMRSTSVQARA